MNKICTKCKIEKPLEDFYKNKGCKYGRTAKCKRCCADEAYFKKYGTLKRSLRSKYSSNPVLGNGKDIIVSASGENIKVDPKDYNKLMEYKWSNNGCNYAVAINNGQKYYMHRLVMNAPKGKSVDHLDGDTFNNTKANLRLVERKQNIQHRTKLNKNNTSGRIGVYWSKNDNKWLASISVNGKQKHLGYYFNYEDAVEAREVAEDNFYGEYKSNKHLNNPLTNPRI